MSERDDLPTHDEIDAAVCSAIYDASWTELANVICRLRDALGRRPAHPRQPEPRGHPMSETAASTRG